MTSPPNQVDLTGLLPTPRPVMRIQVRATLLAPSRGAKSNRAWPDLPWLPVSRAWLPGMATNAVDVLRCARVDAPMRHYRMGEQFGATLHPAEPTHWDLRSGDVITLLDSRRRGESEGPAVLEAVVDEVQVERPRVWCIRHRHRSVDGAQSTTWVLGIGETAHLWVIEDGHGLRLGGRHHVGVPRYDGPQPESDYHVDGERHVEVDHAEFMGAFERAWLQSTDAGVARLPSSGEHKPPRRPTRSTYHSVVSSGPSLAELEDAGLSWPLTDHPNELVDAVTDQLGGRYRLLDRLEADGWDRVTAWINTPDDNPFDDIAEYLLVATPAPLVLDLWRHGDTVVDATSLLVAAGLIDGRTVIALDGTPAVRSAMQDLAPDVVQVAGSDLHELLADMRGPDGPSP